MHTPSKSLLLAAIVVGSLQGVVGRDIPQNLKTFYNNVKAAGTCKNILKGGLADTDNGPKSMPSRNPILNTKPEKNFTMEVD